jgi:Plasmid encoded RepA protein
VILTGAESQEAPLSHKPTPIQQRLLDLATDIATTPAEELAFQHSVLAQTYLPAAKPPDGALTWEVRQGRASLLVVAGQVRAPTGEWVQMGLPYGSKARLLLMHLNSEAIKRQSPIIPVEDSMSAFFTRLMGRRQDGRQVRILKSQLSALAASTFRMGISQDDRSLQLNTQVVTSFELWLHSADGQRVLWPATLELSENYFKSLTRYAVPLDERAIAALAHSALALDMYCWLAQRLHRVPSGRPQFVPWQALFEQFGQGYSEIRFFRRDFLKMLTQVTTAYPDAKLSADKRGIVLCESPPPVAKRLVALSTPVSAITGD